MNAHEWALIAFTILTQMSVGSLLVLQIVHAVAASKKGLEEADRLSDRALLAIVVVMGLALVASLFHLGNPLNAPRAVTHIATSWLSREILAGVVFAVLVVIFAALQWFKVGSIIFRNVVAWITVVIGLVLVYFESRIYMIPAEPAWNTFSTPISFYTTAFLLGCLAMGVAFVANYAYVKSKAPECEDTQCELMHGALKGISIAAIILVGIELLVLPVYLAYLGTGGAAALSTVKLVSGPFSAVLVIRLILAFVGAGVFGAFLYQTAQKTGKEKLLSYLAYSAFVLVLVAEVLGRYMFYATRIRIGI